jgi:DNA-binding MarR family transcriptional regulator
LRQWRVLRASNGLQKIPTNSHYFTDELAASPAYDPQMDDTERDADLLQELYTTGVLVGMLVDEELANEGLPQQLFSFLGWVSRLQPVTPTTLAAETGLPPTTIRDYVRRLVERDDLRKVPNPNDGRSYHLVLTRKGQMLSNRGWAAVVAAFERVEQHLERPAGDHLASTRELRAAVKQALAEREAALQR